MNNITLQGKLARDCKVTATKTGGKMCFMTVQATRDGGTDFLPVKAFDVPEAITAALIKGADVCVSGRLQAGKYDKESKKQLYENIVVADEIKCGGGVWAASAFPATAAAAADAQGN